MHTTKMYERVTIDDFANIEQKYIVDNIEPLEEKKAYYICKRIMDLFCATIALIVLLIPMIIISIIIVIESPGNPIFSQRRLGKDQKEYIMYKFRSMYKDAEKDGVQWARSDDDRCTRVGKFLRKTRIDELPQLLNIIKGEMSFVGPRPERPEFYAVFDTYIHGFRQRMLVKPGLTGLAQVKGGYSLLPEEKILFDIEYIKNRSLHMDAGLIFKTVSVVFKGDDKREEIPHIERCRVVENPSDV